MTWVDFRKPYPDPMERLLFGIAGERCEDEEEEDGARPDPPVLRPDAPALLPPPAASEGPGRG